MRSRSGLSLTELILAIAAFSALTLLSVIISNNLDKAEKRSHQKKAVARLSESFLDSFTRNFFFRNSGGIFLDSTNPYWIRMDSPVLNPDGSLGAGTTTYSVICDSLTGTALERVTGLNQITPPICTDKTGPTVGSCLGAKKRLLIEITRNGFDGPGSTSRRTYPIAQAFNLTKEAGESTAIAAAFCVDVPAAQVIGPPNPYAVPLGADLRAMVATGFLKAKQNGEFEVVWKVDTRLFPVRNSSLSGVTILGN